MYECRVQYEQVVNAIGPLYREKVQQARPERTAEAVRFFLLRGNPRGSGGPWESDRQQPGQSPRCVPTTRLAFESGPSRTRKSSLGETRRFRCAIRSNLRYRAGFQPSTDFTGFPTRTDQRLRPTRTAQLNPVTCVGLDQRHTSRSRPGSATRDNSSGPGPVPTQGPTGGVPRSFLNLQSERSNCIPAYSIVLRQRVGFPLPFPQHFL